MQLAFGDKFTYDRAGLLIVTVGHGPLPLARTLNQAALAQGQVRRAAVCWISCARRPSSAGTCSPSSMIPPGRGRLHLRGGALCALLYLIYRSPRAARRGRARPRLAAGDRGDARGRRRGQLRARRPPPCKVRAPDPAQPPTGLRRYSRPPRRRSAVGGGGLGSPKTAEPATNRVAPASATPPTVSASIPPSTSITGPGARRAQPRDLVGRGVDERLAAPARVDGHAEDEVGGRGQLGDRVRGRAGVERDARQAAGLADRARASG